MPILTRCLSALVLLCAAVLAAVGVYTELHHAPDQS